MSMKKLKLNKKYKKDIFNKEDYLTNEQYNTLFTRFYHKLSMMRYHDQDNFIDYNDYKCCSKLLDTMCAKFNSQTIQYLQHSWNCISMEVDELLRTMLVCVINPSSISKNVSTEIVIVDIPINRDQMEIKDEDKENEDDDDDGFLNELYFDNDDVQTDSNMNMKYDNIMNEFNMFSKEAKESTHSGKKCNDKDDIKIWWENRYKLDKKLKNILQSIESDILGIFRCVLIPNFRHKQSKKLMNSSCHALVKAINEYLIKKTKINI